MQNLAGRGPHPSTEICKAELEAAGITPCDATPPLGEVGSLVAGELRGFKFTRFWYYWVVEGPMPLEAARRIHADPVGAKGVRVAGHCGCPPPVDPWVKWFMPDGTRVWVDPTGKQAEQWEKYRANKDFEDDGARFVRSIEETPGARGFVMSYHVDTAEGLKLLVDTIRSLPE